MDNMTKKAIWKGIAAIIGVMIVAAAVCTALVIVWPLGGGSIIRNMKSSKIELQEIVPLAAEAQIKEKIRIAGSGDAVPAEEDEEAEEEKESNLTADYIIPDSGTKLLTDADIQGLNAQELNYAKNEIYARHGRMFDSKELQDYFNSKSWYKAEYPATEFDAESGSILNETEKKNADFLRDAENELEPGGYKLDQ